MESLLHLIKTTYAALRGGGLDRKAKR